MPISRRAIVLAFGFLLACAPAARCLLPAADANKPPVDDISSLLAESVQKHKLPGMSAAIVENGHITAIGATGVRRRGYKEPFTSDDLVHIGSDTKSMTATLIAILVEEGRLRWDSTPAEVLAGAVKKIDPAWKRVTLEELLTHRGGVRPNPAMITILGALALSPREQRLRVCRAVLSEPPEHEPGKDYSYSNTGYAIAGAMAEAVANDSWENLLLSRVCKPLGMEHVGFGAPGAPPAKSKKGTASSSAIPITQPWGTCQTAKPSGLGRRPTMLRRSGRLAACI